MSTGGLPNGMIPEFISSPKIESHNDVPCQAVAGVEIVTMSHAYTGQDSGLRAGDPFSGDYEMDARTGMPVRRRIF